jgi:uncharacterized protein YukE
MADVRTLKLNLLADVDQFGRSLAKADNSTKSFSKKIGGYGKAMAKSFAIAGAAAGAYAIKLGIDSVKAAAEDELSQIKLAQALRNTTNATDDQIKSTEDYIKKQQISFGIADTKLRPALANLARATGSLTEAQKLNNLAIDISAATGKDLETVSLALAKAYNGNLGALTRLGVPLDASIIKTKDFGAATDELQKLFGGSAQANTKTYAGQLAILQQYFGEIQEDIGAKLIPKLKLLLENVVLVAKGFSGEDPQGLSNRARELAGDLEGNGASSLGGSLRALTDSFESLFKAFTDDGDATTTSMEEMANALESVAKGINSVAKAYSNAKSTFKDVKKTAIGQFLFGSYGPNGMFPGLLNPSGVPSRAAGGPVGANQVTRVGEFGPELFVPSGSGSIRPDNGAGQGVTIIMNGVIDGESARRSIERLLQDSSRRTGAVNLVGSAL